MQALKAGPRADLDEDEILEAISAVRSPQLRHYVEVLDSQDNPTGEIAPVDMNIGGHVKWSYRIPDRVAGIEQDTAAVRRTANVTLVGEIGFNVFNARFRVVSEFLSKNHNWIKWYMGTFISMIPPITDSGIIITRQLELADKTYRYAKPLKETRVILAGTVGTTWLTNDLVTVFNEPRVGIPYSSQVLAEDIVADEGSSHIELYNRVLELLGYDQLITDEEGVPYARPLSDITNTGPEDVYEPGAHNLITAGKLEALLPTTPNVVRFASKLGPSLPEEGNGWATRYNQSTGPASIGARGEEVWLNVMTNAEAQPALEAIADADAQRYFAGGGLRYQGQVGINPRHSDRDVTGLVKPRLGLLNRNDPWLVTDWTYPLKRINSPDAILMDVTWERRVVLT